MIGGGAAVYGASQQKKAAGKALDAQNQAAAQDLALQRETRDQIIGLNEPFRQGGLSAYDMLLQEYGLPPVAGAQPAPATQPAKTGPAVNYGSPSGTYGAPSGSMGSPLGVRADGTAPPRPPPLTPPAEPAPPGMEWVHGPEGYALLPVRESRPFSEAWGSLGGKTGRVPSQGTPTTTPTAAGSGSDDPYGYRAMRDVLGPQGAAPASGPAGPAAPASGGTSPDWRAYLEANPDVKAWAEAGGGDPSIPIEQQTLEQRAAYQFRNTGQAEGRQLPTTGGQAAQPSAPLTPRGPQTPTDLMTAERPQAPSAPTFSRPESMAPPTIGAAPELNPYLANFKADPGYNFRLSEGLKAVNAASAARGKLRSGDAAMALQERADGLASQEYNNFFSRALQQYGAARGAFENDRSYATNLWDTQQRRADSNFADDRAYDTGRWQFDVNRGDQNFNTDRSFQAGRYDTRVGNLFALANTGLQAAGNVSGAATNYANAAGNIFGSQANAASDAAYSRGMANAGMVNSIAGAGANLFANWGGGARSAQAPQVASFGYRAPIDPNLSTYVPTPQVRF